MGVFLGVPPYFQCQNGKKNLLNMHNSYNLTTELYIDLGRPLLERNWIPVNLTAYLQI